MIKPEQLEKIKKILTDLKATEKNCGACGQFFDSSTADGEGFHLPALCDANDEACEICAGSVSSCTCRRCFECATLYPESEAIKALNDDDTCAKCADEIGE